jgi:hypothetical protein
MSLNEADASKAYAVMCDAIQDRIKRSVGRKCVLFFSAYSLDADRLPVDNLDDVPIWGKVQIKSRPIKGVQRRYEFESAVMKSPTWLELCGIANDQLIATRDRNHHYLEAVELVETVGDIQIAEFHFGT